MASLGADEPGVIFEVFFSDCCGRNPQLVDPDALVVLIALRVRKPEKLPESLAMVIVEMGDAYGVEIIAARLRQIAAKLGREIATNVVLIAGTAHIGVIDEHLAPVREVETQGIGIAEGKEVDLCDHEILHRVRGAWHLLI